MAGDALLEQFELPKPQFGQFVLDRFAPVALRDQVVRACFLVERLVVTERLLRDSTLMIVGAGVAGVAAALSAVQHGVQSVVLVEQHKWILSLQAPCQTRWLDPTQYDWPAAHWAQGQWPLPKPALAWSAAPALKPPFELKAGPASELAASLENELQACVEGGQVELLLNAKFVSAYREPGALTHQVHLQAPGPSGRRKGQVREADVVIFAAGFGPERIELDVAGSSYRGHAFWGNDPFEQPDFGIPRLKHGVLVSGGGDGALQDYIRLATGKPSAKAFLQPLLTQFHPQDLAAVHALWHWEDEVSRLASFAPDLLTECERQTRLHQKYLETVRSLHADTQRVIDQTCTAIAQTRPMGKVVLTTIHHHFDACYPLNRFVALIVMEHVQRTQRLHVHWTDRMITRLHGPPLHGRAGTKLPGRGRSRALPALRWGVPVQLEFVSSTNCGTQASELTGMVADKSSLFDGLVIRHGIDRSLAFPEPQRLLRQRTPCHLP